MSEFDQFMGKFETEDEQSSAVNNSELPSHCTAHLGYLDIEKHLKKSDVIVIPVGSHEQHSRHLPLSTDMYPCLKVSEMACNKADVLYLPLMPFGYSPHHMGGAGTATLRPTSIMGVYYDLARSMIHHGYNKIVFVTGHASNCKVMDPVMRRLRYETGALVLCYKPWVERYLGMLTDVLKGDPDEDTPGWHAGESETSAMLYLVPQYVRMDRAIREKAHKPAFLPENFFKTDGAPVVGYKGYEYFNMSLEHREFTDTGCMGNPFDGSAETGKIMMERFADHLADALIDLKGLKVEIKNREFSNRADWE